MYFNCWRFLVFLMIISLLPAHLGCLNPDWVNQNIGGLYPTAPGDTPFVLATVVNETGALLDMNIVADDGSAQPPSAFFTNLNPQEEVAGVLFEWPVFRLSIGDPNDPAETSIVATFPDGLTIQMPFGQAPLVAGLDYNSGDNVVFLFTQAPQTQTGINISVGVIDGTTQQGPFTRADTFETIRQLLILNGLMIP